jgi:hypothetical protein
MTLVIHQLLRIIVVVGQRVAELVRKLKGILCPMRIASRQSDPDAATRRSFEIGLRMIGAIVNVDPVELSAGNAPKFEMPLIPTRQ